MYKIKEKLKSNWIALFMTMSLIFAVVVIWGNVALAFDPIPIDRDHFPDEHMYLHVFIKYDTDKDGFLSEKEINAVTTFECTRSSIVSLKGLEYFTAVNELICTGNDLTELDLTLYPNLEYVSCGDNEIKSLKVGNSTKLKSLDCNGNRILFLDLRDCPALRNAVLNGEKQSLGYNSIYKYESVDGILKITDGVSIITGEIIKTGSNGDNISWTLDKTGVLTISGSGKMEKSISFDEYATKRQINGIIIESGITSIPDYAFVDYSSIKNVYIPETMEEIGEALFWASGSYGIRIDISEDNAAFCSPDRFSVFSKDGKELIQYCNRGYSYEIPEGTEIIGKSAFKYGDLSKLTLPESLTRIEENAFWGCYAMISEIPQNVNYIAPSAFKSRVYYSGRVYAISVDDNNPYYAVKDDILYDKSNVGVVYCLESKEGVVSLDDTVQYIGDYAFQDCKSIILESLPSSLVSIGNYAFQGCEGITELVLPSGVKKIGDHAFQDCKELKKVVLNNGLESIGEYVFYFSPASSQISEIKIPNSVTEIGYRALCTPKVEYEENGMQFIDLQSFGSEVQELVIPESVKSIGTNASTSCEIKTIYYKGGKNSWRYVSRYGSGWSPDLTVYYEKVSIQTESAPSGAGWIMNAYGEYKIGEVININVMSYPYYEFQYWEKNGEIYSTETNISVEVTDGLTLRAVFKDVSEIVVEINEKNFPDKAFREYVSAKFDYNKDGFLSVNEARGDIDCSGTKEARGEIKSLAGAKYINVYTLNCSYNHISELDLSEFSNITTLICQGNDFAELDISENLVLCNIYGNGQKNEVSGENAWEYQIWNETNTGYKYSYKTLQVDKNVNVYAGELDTNIVVAIDSEHFPYDALRDYIKEQYDVSRDGNLNKLEIEGITDISLSSSGNKAGTLQGIEYFPNLLSLYIYNQNLTEVDISSNKEITSVSSYYSNVTKLKASNNSKLQSIFCMYNQITELDIYECPNLQILQCTDNKISSLDLSNFPELSSLSCDKNNITKLDISHCPILKEVYLKGEATETNEGEAWIYESENGYLRVDKTVQIIYQSEIETTDSNLKFAGAALTLEDNLAIKFTVNASVLTSCGVTDPYVIFNFNNNLTTVTDYIYDSESKKYGFVLHNIAPQQINDTVTATLYAKKGNTIVKGRSRNYSVADYCVGMMKNSTDENHGVFETLLVDLMYYGEAAQVMMDYKTDNLMTSRLSDMQKAWRSTNDLDLNNCFNSTYQKVTSPSVKWKGAGLFLEETVAIRYRFMADDYNGITIKVTDDNGHEWTYDMKSPEVKVATEGGYYLYFNGLNAGQMRDKVYATIYRNGERVSHTVRYSVESYVASNQGSTGPFLDLINSMLRYGDSAKAYADSKKQQ